MTEYRFPPVAVQRAACASKDCNCSTNAGIESPTPAGHGCNGSHRIPAFNAASDRPDPPQNWQPSLKSKPLPPRPQPLPISGYPTKPGPDPVPRWDPPISIDESLPEYAQCNIQFALDLASPWVKDKPHPDKNTHKPLQALALTPTAHPSVSPKLLVAQRLIPATSHSSVSPKLLAAQSLFPAIRGVQLIASKSSRYSHGWMPTNQLADAPKPSGYCHNPSGPGNTTPQGCDKEEPDDPGDPPVPGPFVPSYPNITCNQDDSAAELPKGFYGCAGWQETWIRRFHRNAYLIVKSASLTLDWIANMNEGSREFYWNWGADGSVFSGWWHNLHDARYASLGYWFGPYSYILFDKIRSMFATMLDIYENGVHAWGRPRMKYKCNNIACGSHVVARHGAKRYTQICLGNFFAPFWEPSVPRENWIRSRIWTLTHEWFHNIAGVGSPRDRCRYGTCFTGWRCARHQCYQDSGINWTWNFRENPVTHLAVDGNYPRKLIEHGGKKQLADARDNVDNFVSWAIARWVDGQWGDCDGPDIAAMSTTHQANRF